MWFAFPYIKRKVKEVVFVRSICEIQNAVISNGDCISELELHSFRFIRQQLRLLPVIAYIQQPLHAQNSSPRIQKVATARLQGVGARAPKFIIKVKIM